MQSDTQRPEPVYIAPSGLRDPTEAKPGKLVVTVTPCTTTADFEAIAALELLLFPGANAPTTPTPSGEVGPLERISTFAHLHRPVLMERGIPPRYWPDYAPTIARKRRAAEEGVLVLKASFFSSQNQEHVEAGNEEETVVGFAILTPPPLLRNARRNWVQKLKSQVLYPAVDGVKSRLSDQSDGTDYAVINLYKDKADQVRKEIMAGRPYFSLDMFGVHPSYHGRGVGRALLQQCMKFASAEDAPLILESTQAGIPFYKSLGLMTVTHSRFEYHGELLGYPVMVYEPPLSQDHQMEAGQTNG